MKGNIKLLISQFMIAVLSSLFLTGCGILEQEPYLTPLVKVKCRDSKTSQTLPVKTRQKKEITLSEQAKIPLNSETPVPKQPVNIKGISKINVSLEKIMAIDKPLKMISKIIDVAPSMNLGLLLKNPASAQKNHFTKTKSIDSGGIIGLMALICLIVGIIFCIASLGIGIDNFFTPRQAAVGLYEQNPGLLTIGIILMIASAVLAITGLFSDDNTDFMLSVITLFILLLFLIFVLIE